MEKVYYVFKLDDMGADKVDEVSSIELYEALYRELPDADQYYCVPMFLEE